MSKSKIKAIKNKLNRLSNPKTIEDYGLAIDVKDLLELPELDLAVFGLSKNIIESNVSTP